MIVRLAHVLKITLEHHQVVDLNVSLLEIVQVNMLVSIRGVKTHVPDLVVQMLNVELQITFLFVLVDKIIKVIRLLHVDQLL